jgi:hypothetical protein
MKTVLDKATRDELAARIETLTENSQAQWGKMTAAQMLKHSTLWDEMAQGKTTYKQSFIGKLFGKMALRDIMKDEPMKKNLPTVPAFKITGHVDFATEKSKWLQLVGEYGPAYNDGFLHPFFGTMTREDTGRLVYKHVDHHLRQFNA